MTLAGRLAPLDDADEQGALARREAPSASVPELIAALRTPRLGEWATLHIVHELTHRGPRLAGEIADALVAEPLAPGSVWLGEALVELFQDEPSTRPRVVAALIDAADAGLDAGGGTRDAGAFVAQLADLVALDGPLPEATPVARRLLDVAAGEAQPYTVTVNPARRLAGEP
jgi:hypothetical protein